MKNIFIGGVAKSGKSRLSTYLSQKYNMNHIPIDYLTSSFKYNFPEIGITTNVVINKESSQLLSRFMSRFIEIVDSNDEEYFILDSAHILPEDIVKYLNPEKWDIIYLGYTNTNPEEKIKEIKEHITGGWVNRRSNEELPDIFSKLINLSKDIEKTCKENNIKFIDTSNKDILDIYKETISK